MHEGKTIKQELIDRISQIDDTDIVDFFNKVEDVYFELHPFRHNPVTRVKYVPVNKVHANSYNPNSVAPSEMRLLHISISEDGYTQPIVTFYDEKTDTYEIVDGFHRYNCGMRFEDIRKKNKGYLPIVVIDKPLADRMASTVRHNRARGKHAIGGMSNIVFQMLKEGKSDAEICMELGLEIDELLRLKHVTGYAKLFKGVKYTESWETGRQIENRLKFERDKDAEILKGSEEAVIK